MRSIAAWIESVLWRAYDWRVALQQLAVELASRPDGPATRRAAADLGQASEYIEPDRRRAIDVYGLAGPLERARASELCSELGWWAGRGRLAACAGDAPLDEAEAWWDAGQVELCAFALAGVRTAEGPRVEDLASLIGGEDELLARGEAIAARAAELAGAEAADTYVMAARFARAGSHLAERARWLEAALVARPGHAIASAQLQTLVLASRDPALLRRFLRARLEHLGPAAWIDGTRTIAFAMIDGGHNRGFALRMLRRALERAYEARIPDIPGHLAIWTVLATQAAIDNTRRELLPLALAGLQADRPPIDRVWLGALATEITLRDGNSAIVAGAYAELVAEFAPEHPIVHELIAAVAHGEREEAAGTVPEEAVAAANSQLSRIKVDEAELARIYVEAIDRALARPLIEVPSPDTPPTARPATPSSSYPTAASATPTPQAPAPPAVRPPTPPPIRANAHLLRTVKIPIPKPSIAPKPARGRSPVSTPPPIGAKGPPVRPSPRRSQRPSNPDPVFAALRTKDRPTIPPRPPDPPHAIPRSTRIAIPIDVRVVLADGRTIEGHSRDVSTSGMFVIAGAPVDATEVDVVLQVPGEEAFTEQEFRARARIARQDDDGFALTLLDPPPTLIAALAALIEKP